MKKILIVLTILALLFLAFMLNWIYSFDKFPLEKVVNNTAYSMELKAELPHKVTEAGGAACMGKFYHLGGFGPIAQSYVNFYCYSPETDSWERKADFPVRINHPGITANFSNVFVAGGMDPVGIRPHGFMFADWIPRNTLHIYNTETNEWSEAANMPYKQGAGGVCADSNYVYYCGGINEEKVITNRFFRYDIKNNVWEILPPMPTKRDHLRIEKVGNKIIAISGRKDDLMKNLEVVEAFDINTNTWSEVAPIPFPRGGFESCVYNNKIYTFGGEGVWQSLRNIEEYDPKTDTWTVLPEMPEPRHGICAGVINDKVHMVSGGLRSRISISNIHRVMEIK